VTALIAWPNFEVTEGKVDNQMAAPAETRTLNWHRAIQNRSFRVRMEEWRQGFSLGREKEQNFVHQNQVDIDRPSHGRR
jgi:hypothetical protein